VTPLLTVLLCGVALGAGAPMALGRRLRLERWPHLAAYLWVAAVLGALGAVVLAGLLLVLPTGQLGMDVARLLRTCVMALRMALAAPAGAFSVLVGFALLALVTGGLAVGTVVTDVRIRRAERLHRELLALAGRPAPGLPGVTVLDYPTPLAYSLAGRSAPVVLSTAALAHLDAHQLAAMLAHERAHQAGRHHGLVLLAEVLRVGFPWLPTARVGRAAVARLVELAADDVAARTGGRLQVAGALARLGAAPAPRIGLGASGPTAAERIERLTAPIERGNRAALVAGVLVVAVPMVLEVAALAAPIARVSGLPLCPFS
jgi:Zn-dependent protease with chaperone function